MGFGGFDGVDDGGEEFSRATTRGVEIDEGFVDDVFEIDLSDGVIVDCVCFDGGCGDGDVFFVEIVDKGGYFVCVCCCAFYVRF